MQLRVMTEPQEGATYDDLLRVARATEDLGFDAFFRSDHLQRIADGDPGPGSTEAWVTLAGLARETSRIRLGHDGVVGDLPAPRDAGADGGHGRRDERRPGRGRSRQRLVRDRAPVVRPGLPAGGRAVRRARPSSSRSDRAVAHRGRGRRTPSPAATTRWPTTRRCPARCSSRTRRSIVGGKGKRRTPELAARFADEYNVPFDTPEVVGRLLRPGACRVQRRGPRPGVAGAVGGADAGRRAGRRGGTSSGRRDPGATRTSCGRAGSAARSPRWWTRSAGSAELGRDAGSTCRCSTSPTSSTCELVAAEVAPQL